MTNLNSRTLGKRSENPTLDNETTIAHAPSLLPKLNQIGVYGQNDHFIEKNIHFRYHHKLLFN